ncbi:MAG TPA: ABC transporter ATP-binding protein [Planctomycetota bacterium]|nr:ABC transporter ATP-binding protein [Planctomycetota bacterium]
MAESPVPPVLVPPNESPRVVEVEHLSKTYGEGTPFPVHALRDVWFRVRQGEFVAVMGHSGSGKSTLMNMLGCLDRPTKGRYLLNGQDVSRKSRRELAAVRSQTLGFVFQSFHLLPRLTAMQNCEIPLQYGGVGRSERRARAEEVLTRVGLKEKLHRRPTELSGGQQQRVAIARALVNRPRLLLADEPTGNLDTRTGLEILTLLQDLNSSDGLTIVMVTHEPDVAACASRRIMMRDGRIHSDEANPQPTNARKVLNDFLKVEAEREAAETAVAGVSPPLEGGGRGRGQS